MAELKVEKRKGTGKYATWEIRKAGNIPGVVYGGDKENVNVAVPLRDFLHMLHKGERVIDLNMGDETRKVIVQDVQHGTFDREILHADFQVIRLDKMIHVEVGIEFEGEAAGQEAGGLIEQSLFSVQIECLPMSIPEKIKLDISNLKVDEVLYVSDLPAIEGLSYLTSEATSVVACHLPRGEVIEGEEGEEEDGSSEPEVIGEKDRAKKGE